jgi:putative nucleotidyltransferase with HDIG domain
VTGTEVAWAARGRRDPGANVERLRCVVVGAGPSPAPEEDLEYRSASTNAEAEALVVGWEADAVVVDLSSAGSLDTVADLATAHPEVPVVVVAPLDAMPEAVRHGACGLVRPEAARAGLGRAVRDAVARHRRVREALQRAVLRPLVRLRELIPSDGNPEGVLRRLAEVARAGLGADRAAAVALDPRAPDLAVALAEGRSAAVRERFWTLVPQRLADAEPPPAQGGPVLTATLGVADQTLGALTVARALGRRGFDPVQQELLDVLGILGALPLLQVELLRELRRSNQNLIDALAYACELHEASLRGHSERLASYAVAIGRRLGFGDGALENLRVAGMLHDVGKIGISDRILLKPGPLTPEEYEAVKRHAAMGAEILSAAGFPEDVVRWVLHHHERWDGHGYPAGLRGEDIPLGARVLAVADAYEVMTTGRVYRGPLLPGQALEELERERGRQFDPQAVDAFRDALAGGEVRRDSPDA